MPTQEKIEEIWTVDSGQWTVETKLSEVIGSYITDGDGAALLVADLPMLTPPLCQRLTLHCNSAIMQFQEVFIELAPRPVESISCNCRVSLCLSVCATPLSC